MEASPAGRKAAKLRRKSARKQQRIVPVYRYLEPYPSYKLFGDIVLPNSIWQEEGRPIYPLELFLEYKAVRQIHVRENGLVFELEDYNENEVASIPFLQLRLKSLGDKTASELADFLELYQQYFQAEDGPGPERTEGCMDQSNQQPLEFLDDLFNANDENLVFAKGNRMLGKRDYRVVYLGFSTKLIEWVTREKNVFSDVFIRDCFRQAFFNDFEGFTKLLKIFFATLARSSLPANQKLKKVIKTIAGKTEIAVNANSILFPKEALFFQYWVHRKESFDPGVLEKMELTQRLDRQLAKRTTLPASAGLYSNLLRSYYCSRK